LDLSLLSGVKLNTLENQLKLDLKSLVEFPNSEISQQSFAVLAKDLINGNQATSSQLGGTGFTFGSDGAAENLIDTFSKVSISIEIAPYMKQIEELFKKAIDAASDMIKNPPSELIPGLNVEKSSADLDVYDEGTLIMNAAASIKGLKYDLLVDIPFIFTDVKYNNGNFVSTSLNNLKLENGEFKVEILVSIAENDPALQSVFDIMGNILFHRKVESDAIVTIGKAAFGTSKASHVTTFALVQGEVHLKPFVAAAIDYTDKNRPIEIEDIDANLAATGIFADVVFSINAPFKILAGGTAGLSYNVNGEKVKALNVEIKKIEMPLAQLKLTPIEENDAIVKALGVAMVKLLGFQDFASDAQIGYATLIGSKNGIRFERLSNVYFDATNISMFTPLVLNAVPSWHWKPLYHGELRVKSDLSFPNYGPLHLNLGSLDIVVQIGTKNSVFVKSDGEFTVLNKHEGAAVDKDYLSMGKFDISVPVKGLTPIALLKPIASLIVGREMKIDLAIKRDGQELVWVTRIFKGLEKTGVFEQIGPLFGIILSNLRIELNSVDLETIPLLGRLVAKIKKLIIMRFPTANIDPESFLGQAERLVFDIQPEKTEVDTIEIIDSDGEPISEPSSVLLEVNQPQSSEPKKRDLITTNLVDSVQDVITEIGEILAQLDLESVDTNEITSAVSSRIQSDQSNEPFMMSSNILLISH
jgi:hypothetical protein